MTNRKLFAWDGRAMTTNSGRVPRAARILAAFAWPTALASAMSVSCGTDAAKDDVTGTASEALWALSISGTITSAQGPIAGATVDLSGSVQGSTVSGADGAYTFSNLPPLGSYKVSLAPVANCVCSSPINLHNLRSSVTGEDFVVQGSGCGDAGVDGASQEPPMPPGSQCTQCPPGAQGVEGPPGPPSKLDSLVGDASALPQLLNAPAVGNFCVTGEILLFPFAPQNGGVLPANGQVLTIASNLNLFNLLGTTFGGDGVRTFALPNLAPLAPNNTGYYICTGGVFP